MAMRHAILQNIDIETEKLLQRMRASAEDACSSIRMRTDAEISSLPQNVRNLTVREYLESGGSGALKDANGRKEVVDPKNGVKPYKSVLKSALKSSMKSRIAAVTSTATKPVRVKKEAEAANLSETPRIPPSYLPDTPFLNLPSCNQGSAVSTAVRNRAMADSGIRRMTVKKGGGGLVEADSFADDDDEEEDDGALWMASRRFNLPCGDFDLELSEDQLDDPEVRRTVMENAKTNPKLRRMLELLSTCLDLS
ncbi:hypothetical protein HK101_004123 [Irineochytrium annulatum]|nr:hypothetical protein HK101_004123 [Irineochytrium annulatum]